MSHIRSITVLRLPTALPRNRWNYIKQLFNALRLLQTKHDNTSGAPRRDDGESWADWVARAFGEAAIDPVKLDALLKAADQLDKAFGTGSVTEEALTDLASRFEGAFHITLLDKSPLAVIPASHLRGTVVV